MSETTVSPTAVHHDEKISALSDELGRVYAVPETHDWEDLHQEIRSTGVFDNEMHSNDLDVQQRAQERARTEGNPAVLSFMRYIDGSMNIVLQDTDELDAQLEIVRKKALSLSSTEVSFEVIEQAVSKIAEFEARLRMNYPGMEKSIASCIENIPDTMLKELYFYPGQADRNSVAELLSNTDKHAPAGLGVHARLLNRIYSDDSGTVQLNIEDPYVRGMLDKIKNNGVLYEIVSMPERPKSSEQADVHAFNKDVAMRAAKVMNMLGLTPKDNDGKFDSPYLTAAFVRLRNRNKNVDTRPLGSIDVKQLKAELGATYDNVQYLGPVQVRKLHEKFELENLWMYNIGDLGVLRDLENKEPSIIDHLKAGDVTVVFSNIMDDHNGAIAEVSNYRKDSGRTLRFEVSSISSIYRRMAFLRGLGIKPATLVYEAHGDPGEVTFAGKTVWANEKTRSQTAGREDEGDIVLEDDADGLFTLVSEYMQPNRGIDSDDELIGKKQIIISACSSDKDARNRDGSSISFLERVGQLVAHPSKDRMRRKKRIPEKIVQSDVIMYGAMDTMYEKVLPNGRVGFYEKNDELPVRRPVVTKRTVSEELGRVDKLFGTSRSRVKTRAVRIKGGIPVRRAS